MINKERIIWVSVVIGILFFSISQCSQAVKQSARADANMIDYNLSQVKARKWQGKDSLWKAEKKTMIVSIDAMEQSYELEVKSLVKQVEGLRKPKDIQSITITKTETKDSFAVKAIAVVPVPDQSPDQSPEFKFTYNDQWSSFQGRYKEGIVAMNYSIRDSITYVDFEKREGFLKKKSFYTQGISHNPNTKIMGLDKIRRKKVEPIITVSAGLGIVYVADQFRFIPTITIGRHLFSLYSK